MCINLLLNFTDSPWRVEGLKNKNIGKRYFPMHRISFVDFPK